MSPSPVSSRMRNLARQLLAYEEQALRLSHSNDSGVARVFETMRRPLCTITGTTGFRALLARALALAAARTSGLGNIRVKADGSYEGFGSSGVTEHPEAGVELISQLLSLLAGFIGETLLLHILIGTWPNITVFNAGSVGENEHDPGK